MTPNTKTIIRAALAADTTIGDSLRQTILRIIDQGELPTAQGETLGRAYTYREAAQLLRVTTRSIQSYVARGLLDGISGGVRSRRCNRITRESLNRFLSGKAG